MREVINTDAAPRSPLYSQAVRAGGMLYLSGLIGINPSSGDVAGSTIEEQTRQELTNCEAVLAAAGAALGDVVEVGVLLTNPADFDGLNAEYGKWFGPQPPARYVTKLGVELPGILVSIRMTAYVAG
jgi:2-iminobutanoate/2-iminopropanoate deaminase